jgi:predicted Zn finger-like uncharacterized protein
LTTSPFHETCAMLIRCPSCKTTYKVADDLLRGTSPAFRCSRCKHTFELEDRRPLEQAVTSSESSALASEQKDKEEELTFAFPAEEAEPTGSPGPDRDELETPQAGAQVTGGEEPMSQPGSMTAAAHEAETQDTAGSAAASLRSPSQQTGTASPETSDNVFALDPYREQRASVVPYLTLFLVLVVTFGLMTAFHQVHPVTSESLVKKIPLLGTSVLKNTHLKNSVDLQSLRGGFQTIQGSREVFVVTGVAVNLNPIVIRDVRVGGRLYDHNGAEIEQQTIWIGNAISPKIIRGMTIQDISDLQRLKPLKTFDIPPGDSVPFTIVFLKAPKTVKDFGCEVLAAEGET